MPRLLNPSLILCLLLTVSLPASASAACAPAQITVNAQTSSPVAGQPASYSYSACHDSAGDRYTVDVLLVSRDTQTGQIIERQVAPEQTVLLHGQTGAFSGQG